MRTYYVHTMTPHDIIISSHLQMDSINKAQFGKTNWPIVKKSSKNGSFHSAC
jgi:hypothetical protein